MDNLPYAYPQDVTDAHKLRMKLRRMRQLTRKRNIPYKETKKNLSYIRKREDLAKRATEELGVTCFG